MPPVHGTNQRVADRLLSEGRLGADEHRRAVEHAGRNRARIEDALIELNLVPEGDLLKFIATLHNTRFVSTEKLAKAAIDARVLSRVSPKTANLHGVFPVLLDETKSVLSVVTADPDNDVALHEVKLGAGVREVRPLVARPAAVRAAIARYYDKNPEPFEALLRPAAGPTGDFIDVDLGMAPPARAAASPGASAANRAAASPPPRVQAQTLSGIDQTSPSPHLSIGQTAPSPVTGNGSPSPVAGQTQFSAAGGATQAQPRPVAVVSPTPPPPSANISILETHEYIESLNVLVSLLEANRQDLRGHSAAVARLTRRTCERIGLSASHVAAFVAAAYLHDLGKMGAYHLTALNVAEYEGHRVAGLKAVALPAQLMASVGLPAETVAALSAMYERYDGRGLPHGFAGKEIPLGARVLAVTDTYADLTQNPRNPFRKILRPTEACEVLAGYRGTIFDPNIVDLFRNEITGDDMRAKLLSERHTVLIVDPDPEETTVLELRLIEQGFEVRVARTVAQAWRELEGGEITAVVSEIDLEEPEMGLALRADALKESWGRDATWVVLTRKGDRHSAQRAFDLNVDDFVSKPTSADIFAAKLRQLIERRAARSGGRGVSGSLAEMSIPDMVQVLWHGRKTCALRISTRMATGEIYFADGQIVDARWDQTHGEDAFYRMLALHEGEFRLDPGFEPAGRTITVSPEALLLEGMRRLDEGMLAPH
jgi:response regulator RpfG family c-di-GMP phosphodiesterase